MDIFEFELRYLAYTGMNQKFKLDWDQETILDLVKISGKGSLSKKLQDTKPEELKEITLKTYSDYKTKFIKKHGEQGLYKDNEVLDKEMDKYIIKNYIERLEYELKVIKEMGFNTYFLIVSDFVIRAKNNNVVVGPGRGSGAGSLLAWFTEITDIDPIPYDLLFERFLNPARISMPDFDIDFEDQTREKVIDYVVNKYGQDNVCSIGTFMQLARKAAFKDSARVLGVDFERSNKFSALMPDDEKVSELLEKDGNDEIKSMVNSNDDIQKAVQFGENLEGNMRQLGIHACGIIIAPDRVVNFTPTQYIKEDDHTIVSQYDGPTLETIGLLKMDFLGLRNLSVIRNCIKIIKARHEVQSKELPRMFQEFYKKSTFNPPLDDKYTYDTIFKKGDTTGIFQFESQGMRSYLVKLEASSINDLIAMNALYRPGPMESIPNYIDRKKGKEEIKYLADELKYELTKRYSEEVALEEGKKLKEDLGHIMDITYGIAVFQEQIMFLVQSMAGFSLAEADLLRRGVGKKKKDVIEKVKKDFIKKGAEYRNYKKETSKYIYEKMIEPAASYSFNKSHSVCYSRIAFQTAYLKAHYPIEFYAALIRSVEDNTDELSNYIKETENHGIIVKIPNVNESFNHVAAIEDYIRLGFVCIKGVGFDVGKFIQDERRNNGEYKDLGDFLSRCENVMNKKSLESLAKSGALDIFADRKIILENVSYLLDRIKGSKTVEQGLFGGGEINTQISFPKKTENSTLREKLLREQESFKTFVSVNLLDGLYNYLKKNTFISQIKEEKQTGPFKIIGFISNIQRARRRGFFVKIEDISLSKEFFFKDIYDFQLFDMLIISGNKREGKYVNPDKIIKTSRKKLIELAGGKYDPELTVIIAKKNRLEENIKSGYDSEISNIDPEISEDNKPPLGVEVSHSDNKVGGGTEVLDSDHTQDGGVTEGQAALEEDISNKFKLPDDVENIKKLKKVLLENKGNISIHIGDLECFVDEKGLEMLQNLMS